MGITHLSGAARDGFATVMPGKLWRFDGTFGATRCSAGWPGTPGMFTDATIPNVRGFLDGKEVPIAVQALRGKHPDGSYRAIGVQVQAAVSTFKRAFRLEIWSTARSVGNTLTWIEPTSEVPSGEDATDWPAVEHLAVVACTDPDHLCDTFVALQPLTPATDDVATVAAWRATMLAQWTDAIANGVSSAGLSIYDHTLGCIAYYCRSGDPTFYEWAYKWGVKIGGPDGTIDFQSLDYLLPSPDPTACTGYATWNPELIVGSNGSCGGMAEAYSLRTWSLAGSYWTTAWRQPMRHIARIANDTTWNFTSEANVNTNWMSSAFGVRFNFGIRANSVLAGYLTECTTEFQTPAGVTGNLDDYPTLFDWMMASLATNEYAPGNYRDGMVGLKITTTDAVGEGGVASDWQLFQTAVVAEWLMMYYDLVEADTRIPTWLLGLGEILDSNIRASNSGESGYPQSYVNPYLITDPASLPASGLTGWTLGMHAPLFGWLWAHTADTKWRDLCDAAMVPQNITDLTMQTKIWGELWGGTRQAAAYYRNGGTIRGISGVAGTGAVQPTTHAGI